MLTQKNSVVSIHFYICCFFNIFKKILKLQKILVSQCKKKKFAVLVFCCAFSFVFPNLAVNKSIRESGHPFSPLLWVGYDAK